MPSKSVPNDNATIQLLSAIIRELGTTTGLNKDSWNNVGNQLPPSANGTPVTGHAARQRFNRLSNSWQKQGLTGNTIDDDDQEPAKKTEEIIKQKAKTIKEITEDDDVSGTDSNAPACPQTPPAATTTKKQLGHPKKIPKKPEPIVEETAVEAVDEKRPMKRSRTASEESGEESKSSSGKKKLTTLAEKKMSFTKGKQTTKPSSSKAPRGEQSSDKSEVDSKRGGPGRPHKKKVPVVEELGEEEEGEQEVEV